MKFIEKLNQITDKNNSVLCVGLDTDINLIPKSLHNEANPVLTFNQKIIDATKDLVCAYKLNSAFYEAQGALGWETLQETRDYIPDDIPAIIDAKRGDIGNTSKKYAQAFFEDFEFDAITLSPYMGFDAVQPFLEYEDKCAFILCLTSNKSAGDLQMHGDEPLYMHVAKLVSDWNSNGNCGLVVGATKAESLRDIRAVAPDLPILIPGIGAQGGNIELTVKYGGTPILINSSRSIIYASRNGYSTNDDFDTPAREAALKLKNDINKYRISFER